MPDLATVEEAREALERAEKATPGPWRWAESGAGGIWGDLKSRSACCIVVTAASEGHDADVFIMSPHDANLIRHARTDVPKLANTVIVQAEEIGRLRPIVQELAVQRMLLGMAQRAREALGES